MHKIQTHEGIVFHCYYMFWYVCAIFREFIQQIWVLQIYSVIYQQVLNLVFKLPEDDADMPKHVEILKDCTSKFVCNLYIKLV